MKYKDKQLGMDRQISRRDFIHGLGRAASVAALAGTGALSLSGCSSEELPAEDLQSGGPIPVPRTPAQYPPLRQGLRGSQPGAAAWVKGIVKKVA